MTQPNPASQPPQKRTESHPLQPTPYNTTSTTTVEGTGYVTPVAPTFSPITPKTQPVFPATYPIPSDQPPLSPRYDSTVAPSMPAPGTEGIAPAEYIPQPAARPFSSEDSADAIALRAAISTLQFQKKKAQEDLRALEGIRKKAVEDPEFFKSELAAGRLKEQRAKGADLQAILAVEDEAENDNEDEDDMQVDSERAPFEAIPGPQNVVRMPNINWEKYHVSGEALDRLHEQQRKWPGSFEYGDRTGREFSVAAPYNPWQDVVDNPHKPRKDSHVAPGSVVSATTSEHPMETRRGGRH